VPGHSPPTVVLVSHTAPPQGNAGAARLESFTRYLPEHGWRPVVVTSRFAGEGAVGNAPTVRAWEPLLAHERLTGRPAGSSPTGQDAGGSLIKRSMQALAVPDLHIGWAPGAALAAARAVRRFDARVIVSSSPSESSHLAALAASGLTRRPWVAEFRDGWTVDSLRELERRPVRLAVERSLEQVVGRRATARVGVTRPIAAHLEQRFGSAEWIPNGFDDFELEAPVIEEARALLDPEAFNLVYTGTFSRSRASRSPEVLAQALEQLALDGLPRPVRLTVVGRLEPHERELLGRVSGVRVVDQRPQPVALALQRLADALVVVTMPGERTVATGKLFEYLGAGRPILALAEGNEAAALVGELGAGLAVPPTDVGAVAGAVERLVRGEAPSLDPRAPQLARFHRRALAGRLAALLDDLAPAPPEQAGP
jgi:glycosyltransferase involved in cell wall biosynthesis